MSHSFLVKKITTSWYYSQIFKKNEININILNNLLADQKSKQTLNGILKAYTAIFRKPEYYFNRIVNDKCCNYHFTTLNGFNVYGTENPYFLDEIFDLGKDMVYLDGGAYIGDTIQLLFRILGGACKYTYAFEPNDENFEVLKKSVSEYSDTIECFKLGLDKHDNVVSFLKADAGSRITPNGIDTINVIDSKLFLNNLVHDIPTFIKLDIEGRELAVLESISEFIKTNHPDLAVSIYHKLEDLWEIPLFIHSLNPSYKIYIRHQSNYFTETVCYAKKTD